MSCDAIWFCTVIMKVAYIYLPTHSCYILESSNCKRWGFHSCEDIHSRIFLIQQPWDQTVAGLSNIPDYQRVSIMT